VNLLLDPSFEGDGNDWEYSLPPYAGTKVQRDTTVAHSGRASIRIQGQSGMFPARTGVGQVLNHRALAGKRVRASAWGRTDSLKTNASIKIFGHTPTRTVPVIIGPALSETTPWTRLSDEFDLPPDLQSLWIWFSIDTPAKGFMHWDDVSLEIVGPAKSVPEGDTR
jgi:hypothetical protein